MQLRDFVQRVKPIILIILFFTTTDAYSFVADSRDWENFGQKVLYFWPNGFNSMPGWLKMHKRFADAISVADSHQSVLEIEAILEQALESYEEDSFVWQGRIALHKNPCCILGLYMADRYPQSRLGYFGKQVFNQAVEHALVVTFGVDVPWQGWLETQLNKVDGDSSDSIRFDFFSKEEHPFLLIYLLENSNCEKARRLARKALANYFWERYELAAALRHYRLLLPGEGDVGVDEHKRLQVARYLDNVGLKADAKRLYEDILRDTEASEIATHAAEALARAGLGGFRQIAGFEVLERLYKKFPNAELTAKDLRDFYVNFRPKREEISAQVIKELHGNPTEEDALKLCAIFDGLWSEQEAVVRWQDVVAGTEPNSIGRQLGQTFLAGQLVSAGESEQCRGILDNVVQSFCCEARARALVILAETALSDGRITEAAAMCRQAKQIKRPVTLPRCIGPVEVNEIDVKVISGEELDFLVYFLQGYNELLTKNFRKCVSYLLKAMEHGNTGSKESWFVNARRMIPAMLMLAQLETGDHLKAEMYGLDAIKWAGMEKNGGQMSNLVSQFEFIEDCFLLLANELRVLQMGGSKSQVNKYVRDLYAAIANKCSFKHETSYTEYDLAGVLWYVKKQYVAGLLSAQYDLLKSELSAPQALENFSELETLIFTSELLRESSVEHISVNLAAVTPQQFKKGQMYRFAKFAQEIKRPDMADGALDAATVQLLNDVRGNAELLSKIAEMYVKGHNHQKAIQLYKEILKHGPDANFGQEALLKVVSIYTEELKLYGDAIKECETYLEKFAQSPHSGEVEFLIGKLSYLGEDYAGAIGRLDMFRKRYPGHSRTGEAMMLAAVSQISAGDNAGAIERLKEIIEKYPEGDLAARSKFLIGYTQFSELKYSEAMETFKELVEQFPASKYEKNAQDFIERLGKMSQ